MTTDKRTKAELIEALSYAEMRNEELSERPVPRAPEKVPEAEALAACIRAIDGLNGNQRRIGYMPFERPESSDVGRILRSLADRYGVRLIETVPIECKQPHINGDELAMGLANTIQNAMRTGTISPDWNRA